MKNRIKRILQKTLGYHNYLFVFALYVIYTLRFQKKEKDFLYFLNLIPVNKSALDIGANIGVMSYYLSKKLKHQKIYAFEPQPDNLKIINKIIKFFSLKNVLLFDVALGNINGTIEMVLPIEGKAKLHGLSHVCHETIEDFNNGEKCNVLIKTLDDIEELKQIKIGGIKLDVENFEFFVLEGGKNLISENKPIIYTELWENQNREKCFVLLQNLGYSCKILVKKELIDYNPAINHSQNFFFIPLS